MSGIDVRLLGPVDLVVHGQIVRPSAGKVRALLSLLALDAGRPLHVDALADRLWSGRPPSSARSVVRTYITQLRRLLDDGSRLERSGDGYVLHLGDDELDVGRFDALVDVASAGGLATEANARTFEQALGLWRGAPLVEVLDDTRAQAEAARLHSRRWSAVDGLAAAELELGLHESAVSRLEAAVREEPLREHLVSRLMVGLYRCGRQADALAAYQRLRRTLVEELGLEPSEELRTVEAAVLAQDASLAAPTRAPGNVPTPLTSFVGRDEEVADVRRALGRSRLVTLTGAGGSGKTRLAIEVARQLEDRPDGVWLVELAARSEDEVATAVLEALGIERAVGEDHLVVARTALAARRLVVVLDNCEHVIATCADVAATMLGASPALTILATSRAALRVPGEVVVAVAPLETPPPDPSPGAIEASPAVRLLADRVTAARGGRAPRNDELAALATLSQRLDGLPLAMEIIASRAAVVSLDDLASSVGAHLLDDTSGARRGEDQHRSVVACVEWSMALLDVGDLALLRRVALLPGWFSPDAAAAVNECTRGEVLLGLARLAGQSLLEAARDGSGRLRMLEPIREVVRSTGSDADVGAALDALTRWMAVRAEELEPATRGRGGPRLLADLDAERQVMHLALDHGLGLSDPTDGIRIAAGISSLWAQRGHLREGAQRLARAVAVSERVAPALRMRLLISAGTHLMTMGDLDGYLQHVETALAIARRSADGDDALRVLLWAGHALRLDHETATAEALYGEALSLAQASADRSSTASAFAGLGDVAVLRDDLEHAMSMHLQSLAEFRSCGDRHGEGQALLNIADVHRRRGRYDDAGTRLEEAVAVFESISDRSCIAATIEGRARIAADRDDLGESEQLYRDALLIRAGLDQDRHATDDLRALADVLLRAGRPLDAAAALGAAGEREGPLANALQSRLGDHDYLVAWSEGAAGRAAAHG